MKSSPTVTKQGPQLHMREPQTVSVTPGSSCDKPWPPPAGSSLAKVVVAALSSSSCQSGHSWTEHAHVNRPTHKDWHKSRMRAWTRVAGLGQDLRCPLLLCPPLLFSLLASLSDKGRPLESGQSSSQWVCMNVYFW